MELKRLFYAVYATLVFVMSFTIYASAAKAEAVTGNKNAGRYVALTFDDGPHKEYTAEILDILKANNAKATFFVIGKNAKMYSDLIKREFDEGHEIGNHTYTHPSMREINAEALVEEIEKTQELVEDITGKAPVLFRSPGGYLDDDILKTIGSYDCTPVLWSWRQDTRDWSRPPVKSVVDTVLNNIRDGDIVLFHDYNLKGSPTPEALRVILPELKKRGYNFVTVSQLLSIKSESEQVGV